MANIDDTLRALEQQGFEEPNQTELGGMTTIDFTIPAPLPGMSARSVKSSLLLGADGEPRSFILRLPVAKTDDYPERQVFRAVEQAMTQFELPDDLTKTFYEQGNFSILPHIETVSDDVDGLPSRGTILARQFNTVVDAYFEGLRGMSGP